MRELLDPVVVPSPDSESETPAKEAWERPAIERATVTHDTAQSIGSVNDGGLLTTF